MWDTGLMGYSSLAVMLRSEGYNPATVTESLPVALAKMGRGDVLVLGIAKNGKYSQEDKLAIETYAQRGGSLLILGEHDNIFSTADFQNSLVSDWGFRFLNSFIEDKQNNLQQKKYLAQFRSPLLELDQIFLMWAAPLIIDQPKKFHPFLISYPTSKLQPESIAAVWGTVQRGRAIGIGDSELFWNSSQNLSRSQNYLFTRTIFRWLTFKHSPLKKIEILPQFNLISGKKLHLKVNHTPGTKLRIHSNKLQLQVEPGLNQHILTGEIHTDDFIILSDPLGKVTVTVWVLKADPAWPTIFIDHSAQARRVDDTPSGLLLMAKRLRDMKFKVMGGDTLPEPEPWGLVMANPLKTVDMQRLLKIEHLLLAAESFTSSNQSFLINTFFDANSKEIPSPIGKVAKYWGLRIVPNLICQPLKGDKFFKPVFSFKMAGTKEDERIIKIGLTRSSAIIKQNRRGHSYIKINDSAIYLCENNLGYSGGIKRVDRSNFHPFIMEDKTLFLADTDLLTNENIDRYDNAYILKMFTGLKKTLGLPQK